jgi:hypothetical protein
LHIVVCSVLNPFLVAVGDSLLAMSWRIILCKNMWLYLTILSETGLNITGAKSLPPQIGW